jgi:hypothetical protein
MRKKEACQWTGKDVELQFDDDSTCRGKVLKVENGILYLQEKENNKKESFDLKAIKEIAEAE